MTTTSLLHALEGDKRLAIVAQVAVAFGVEVDDILSRSRSRAVTDARATAIWLCIQRWPRHSITDVGLWFDRDHTTVMYNRDVVARRLDTDPAYNDLVQQIARDLGLKCKLPRPRRRGPTKLLLLTMRDHIALAVLHTHAVEIGHVDEQPIVLLGDGSIWIGGRLLTSPLLRTALRSALEGQRPRRYRSTLHLPRRNKAVAAD